MLDFLYGFFNGLFHVFSAVWEFLFWDLICGYRWKQRDVRKNSEGYWIGATVDAERRLREVEYKSRREKEELESRYRQIIRQKEREIALSQRS